LGEGLFEEAKKTSSRDITMDIATISEQPLLITLEQAAQRLAISRRTLERLIAAGEFPSPLKLGRASRLAVDDIDSYCAQLRARRVSNHEVAHD
jgi:excisionase family DNA binding protein